MNLKTPNATIAIGAIALVLTALLGWFTVISPASAKLAESQEALASVEEANRAAADRLKQLEQAEKDLPLTRKIASELSAIFPQTAAQAQFFNAVTAAAADAGISAKNVINISPSVPAPLGSNDAKDLMPGDPLDAPVASQSVSISVDATHAQAAAMLGNLESMDRAVFIDSVSLSGSDGNRVTMSISATTFVAPPLLDPESASNAAEGVRDEAGGADAEPGS